MHKFAVKIIGDEDEAYDYISEHEGEEAEELEAAYEKDAEDVYYFECYCPEEHKDKLDEVGAIFRDEDITERYEENWGKIAVICTLEELEGKKVEAYMCFNADKDGLMLEDTTLYDMKKGYTREEFLDEFNSLDVEDLGLEFPEESEMRDVLENDVSEDAEMDELKDEFYYQCFIQRLENKLWDSPEAENTKYELGSILSFWEDVV